MQTTTCTRCSAKINPGVAHACIGTDYQIPVALEILDELKRIRELLEAQQPVNTDARETTTSTKARKRETR